MRSIDAPSLDGYARELQYQAIALHEYAADLAGTFDPSEWQSVSARLFAGLTQAESAALSSVATRLELVAGILRAHVDVAVQRETETIGFVRALIPIPIPIP